MSTPEFTNHNDALSPDQLMSGAEGGFSLSHAFVSYDADQLRVGAAAMLEKGAGSLLYDKLTALGMTDDQIEKLAEEGLLEETLFRLAPNEMAEIGERLGRIVASDPHARNAIENEIYLTDRELGHTKND